MKASVLMQIKKIDANSRNLKELKAINDEAFPPVERMSIEEMFTFPINSEMIGFYDEETLIGFSLLLLNSETVFLVLLAIDKRYRGNGYGSRALRSILSNYPEKQVVLDYEEVVKTAINYEQRASRKQFYLRNGFHETGRFTVLSHEKYEVVCSQEALNENSLNEVLFAIHQHTPEFEERLQ